MTVTGVIIGFDMEDGDSLAPLLGEGFSKPEKTERGMTTRSTDFQHSAGVEIERIGNRAFVTIHTNSPHDADDAVREVVKLLSSAGLV